MDVTISAETKRIVDQTVTITADTRRKVIYIVVSKADTLRQLPFNYKLDTNKRLIKSIELTMNAGTFSDSITLEVAQEMKPNDVMIGTLLDYDYKMKVEKTSQKDIICTCDSMYFMDELIDKYFVTGIDKGMILCFGYAKKLANMIGLTPVIMFDKFYKDYSFSRALTKYNDMLSQAFGWTTSMPWRQINIFIRGDKLYFLQRGKEPNVIDISGLHIANPTIQREVYKTDYVLTSKSGVGTAKHGFTVNWPDLPWDDTPIRDPEDYPTVSVPTVERFSGVLICGNTEVTYTDGLMTHKTVKAPDDSGIITYDGEMRYDEDRRLIYKKEEASDNSYTVTEVAWGSSDNGSNTTEETQYEDGEVVTRRVTVNEDLGNGFVGTSVYVDGEYQGSSISGSGTSTPNNYTTDVFNDAMNRNENNGDQDTTGNGNDDKGDVPTGDFDVLAQYAEEIWSYDRKIQETVTLEIYEPVVNGVCSYNHVIDFTDRIKWKGNEYYLQSNRVYVTPTEMSQTITMIRWY